MKLAFIDPQHDYPNEELSKEALAKEGLGIAELHHPSDHPHARIQTGRTDAVTPFAITKSLRDELVSFSSKQGVSLYMTLLATFKLMLYRYNSRQEVTVGAVINSNLIVLQSEVTGEATFVTLLQQLKSELWPGAEVPQGKKSEYVAVNSDNNLFREIFIFQDNVSNPNAEALSLKSLTGGINYDLALTVTDVPGRLHGKIDYAVARYDTEAIHAMGGHYVQLLSSVLKAPDQKIGSLNMLAAAEQHAILYGFNDTLTAYSYKKTITDLFEEQVKATPANIALEQGDASMSYVELNEHANRLANYLITLGVKKGDNVGLIATRSFNMIIGMYAIMKAGGAYVPIDPDYPVDRQEYILNNSTAELIISDVEYSRGKKNAGFRVVNFDALDLSDYNKENPGIKVNSTQLAYTIYTSGSTGLPKGVMIEHHSVVNLIEWVNSRFNVGADDRLLFITSMCFDLSVYDIFGMLATGGSIVIAKQQEVIDVTKLKDLLQRFKITFWDSVPTTMNYLIKELIAGRESYLQTDLRLIFLSGDWVPVQLPGEIKQYFPNASVISLGGATEAAIWSNYFPVTDVQDNWASIPYGKPISNNFFYVLNEQLQPVPRGITGELYIGGVGVARGYANDPGKTAYSFITDPFNKSAGGRMYRTGDLGRMLPDGNLEFLGRKDTQIKIRGYRVEMGEIESVLNQHRLINQAVVVVKTGREGNKVLIAYVVPKKVFDRQVILSYLKSKLPEYMVPALLIELPQFPLTPNGKIDKKALSELDVAEHERSNYRVPHTENQKKMAAIWQEILGVDKIGINDNFFELGGHSLIAVRMIARLEKEMGAKLPLAILFKYPTIGSLLSFIEKENNDLKNTWKSLVPIKSSGNKMPLYIIHGSGLNVLSFSDIAMHVDPDQPVFGLQAQGLNSIEDASDDMSEIARSYISEILENNPTGPYAIAGYSFGGYVAVEMRRQLEEMGKEVKMLAIFDTNAVDADHYKLSTKIRRQFPKLLWFIRSLIKHPGSTLSYQSFLFRKNLKNISEKVMGVPKVEANDFYSRLKEINRKHWRAFRKYNLTPFNDQVHLFRARERIYFVDDFEYLGWNKFAKKGVRVYDVSGDHRTMLLPPHARKFASVLQEALDNC